MSFSSFIFSLSLIHLPLPITSSSCPPQKITCGHTTLDIEFPFFTDKSSNECLGLHYIQCMNLVPIVQFKGNSYLYPVLKISYHDKAIIIHDHNLGAYFRGSICIFLYDFKFPIPGFDFNSFSVSPHSGESFFDLAIMGFQAIAVGLQEIPPGVSIAAGILLISILCFIGLWRLLRRHQKQRQYVSSSLLSYDSSITGLPFSDKATDLTEFQCQTQMFTYEELHEATNSFDTAMEIGDGGFGAVYKGTLRDGRTVAVKRLYDSNFKGAKQFVNEIMILSRLRHQNLVTLYGCTSPRSPQLLLVYELVPNGTVADHLHGHRADEDLLTWPRRLSVAVETASALGYLHAVDPPIIHRDIKTENILLDAEFHVKVADFGLSRLIPGDGATHISTAPQGTPGYLDPEYHWSYQLTDRSDVYSFGVVLAELLSSKPAVDLSRERTEINLSTLAMNRIQSGNFDDLVDRKLGYDSDAETRRKMRLVAELAFRCLQADREMRPAIKEVLEVLIGLQNGASLDGSGEVEHYVEQVVGGDLGLEKVVKDRPVSPDTVTQKWVSVSSTPTSSH